MNTDLFAGIYLLNLRHLRMVIPPECAVGLTAMKLKNALAPDAPQQSHRKDSDYSVVKRRMHFSLSQGTMIR